MGVDAVNGGNVHGSGISCVDFDLDGDDDLTFAIDGAILTYRNSGGTASLVDFGFSVDNNAKHPVWVDYDNDGDLDFYFTQSLFPNKLYQNNNGLFSEVTEEVGLPQTYVSTFGSAWGDYDNDGDLDLFECTYIYTYLGENPFEWHNHLHRNNSDGTFSDVTLEAGVSDGISLSFQSIWSDLNNDGWLDLYVINDLEHPNRLYLNNTNGTFTEVAEEWSAAVAEMDAMTASIGDYNNDGWQDIFITNTSIGQCALLRNTGSGFENMANPANVELNMLTWGAAWFDADLDMDLDLYVCENNYLSPQLPNPYLRNNGAGFFINAAASTFFFDNYNSYSVAILDWNQDGRSDLAVNNYTPQNASLWRSNQAGNGWLKVKLSGTVSNSQGVGARVTVWSEGTQQLKELFAGENYLGQNSNTLLFGSNENDQIDSIVVEWPSGIMDKWFSLSTNQLLDAVEGSSYACSLTSEMGYVLCEGDSLLLEVDGHHTDFLWSTGNDSSSIWISEPTSVFVTTWDEWGNEARSDTLEILASTPPSFSIQLTEPLCFGDANGSIELIDTLNFESLLWMDGNEGLLQDSLATANYEFSVWNSDGCRFEYAQGISSPIELIALAEVTNVSCFEGTDGTVTLEVNGGTMPYQYDWMGSDPLVFFAGNFTVLITDLYGCEEIVTINVEEPEPLSIEVTSIACVNEMVVNVIPSGGTMPYSLLWSNGAEGELFTATIGTYAVYLTDVNGCLFSLTNIECPMGYETLEAFQKRAYPNPADQTVNLRIPFDELGCMLKVMDARGVTVFERQMNQVKEVIDVSLWAPGLYLFNGERIIIE